MILFSLYFLWLLLFLSYCPVGVLVPCPLPGKGPGHKYMQEYKHGHVGSTWPLPGLSWDYAYLPHFRFLFFEVGCISGPVNVNLAPARCLALSHRLCPLIPGSQGSAEPRPREVLSFPRAAVTNHQLCGWKKQKYILVAFPRPEVQNQGIGRAVSEHPVCASPQASGSCRKSLAFLSL